MCHKNDPEEDPYEFVVKVDTSTTNPRTGKPFSGVSALCLGCHNGDEAIAVDLEHSHPLGVAPDLSKVKVPKDALEFSGEEGKLSCGSCHDWHPDNENYRYLRWKAKGRYYLSSFCSKCHADKANPEGKGAHGQCALCHSNHEGQGPVMLTEEPNTFTVNPHTGKTPDRIASLCLACHTEEPDGAGYRPINLSTSHPMGVTPQKAAVPPASLGFAGEKVLTCLSCHDEHPSNKNYAYLRWPLKSKQDIPKFCGRCHSQYKDKLAAGIKDLSTSMVGVHSYFREVKSLEDYLGVMKFMLKKQKK
jgi:predicted CXXCH cytochrome family protein